MQATDSPRLVVGRGNEASALPYPVVHFRPRDIGAILDQAVVIYRRNFMTFLGIGAVVQVPASLLLTFGSIWLLDPATTAAPASPGFGAGQAATNQYDQAVAHWLSDVLSRLFLFLLLAILANLLLSVAEGALARAIADRYTGRSTTILGSYRAIRGRIPALLGMTLFLSLASLTILIPPIFAWLFVSWRFTSQAIVLEGAGVGAALGRSWELVRGSWWRVFGAYLLLLLLSLLLLLPSSVAQTLLSLVGASWEIQNIGSGFATLLGDLLFVPFQLTAMTLLYFDLRVRKEGLDLGMALDERAGKLGLVAAPPGGWPYFAPAPRVEG